MPRDSRTEPNRAESSQLSRAGPQVPNRTETSRVPRSFELSHETGRAKLIGLSFESSLSHEPTPSLKHRGEQRFEPRWTVALPRPGAASAWDQQPNGPHHASQGREPAADAAMTSRHHLLRQPTPACAGCSARNCPAARCIVSREEADSPRHILLRCPSLAGTRLRLLGSIYPPPEAMRDATSSRSWPQPLPATWSPSGAMARRSRGFAPVAQRPWGPTTTTTANTAQLRIEPSKTSSTDSN